MSIHVSAPGVAVNVTVVVLWNVVASEACTPRRSTCTSYPVTATSVERSSGLGAGDVRGRHRVGLLRRGVTAEGWPAPGGAGRVGSVARGRCGPRAATGTSSHVRTDPPLIVSSAAPAGAGPAEAWRRSSGSRRQESIGRARRTTTVRSARARSAAAGRLTSRARRAPSTPTRDGPRSARRSRARSSGCSSSPRTAGWGRATASTVRRTRRPRGAPCPRATACTGSRAA